MLYQQLPLIKFNCLGKFVKSLIKPELNNIPNMLLNAIVYPATDCSF